MKPLVISSPAKLNLFLDVLNKRSDGYHNLLTLFERISLCDTIRLTNLQSNEIVISSSSPAIPTDHRNLAYQTADLIRRSQGVKNGVKIEIEKNIPVGGGLGGGSSNAASVLLGLNKLFGLKLHKKILLSYANRLGCDVAFFVLDKPFALGRGKGGDLEAIEVPKKIKLWHILFIPPIQLLTKDVYGLWDKEKLSAQNAPKTPKTKESLALTKKASDVNILLSYLRKNRLSLLNQHIYNQLSETVMKSYTLVSELRNDLLKSGLKYVHMSGSGPALFTTFKKEKEAKETYAELQSRLSDRCRVFLTHTC
jgi:4-diphosphocytidyl-2-C-methyl-D-erythritol kinase